MPCVVLASTSPRRRQLLQQIGLELEVVAPQYEEVMRTDVAPVDLAIELALGKAQSVAHDRPNDIVIGADTFIIFQNDVIGKPGSAEQARQMLHRLQGQQLLVATGWAAVHGDQQHSGVVQTSVWLAAMTSHEIDAYVATGEPLDKAGAFAVTGKGAFYVERIDGSIDATVGLPLGPVVRALSEFGVEVFQQ